MRLARQIAGSLLGLAATILGLLGPNGAVAPWLPFLSKPVIAIPLVLFGVFVLALSWADFIADHRNKAERPARFSHWDPLNFFEVWHVAYLWAGLEPYDRETQKTRAYPEFRRLKEDLDAGVIPKVTKDGTWVDAKLARQQLIDYAVLRRERPKFLFPYMRSLRKRVHRRVFGPRDVDPDKIREYTSTTHWISGFWVQFGRDVPYEEIQARILKALRSEEMEAIGRPEIGNLELPYVKIPISFWKNATTRWEYEVPIKGPQYKSVLIRLSAERPRLDQPSDSALSVS